jgi:hypothetical protein
MSYRDIHTIPTQEIVEACKTARCFRQANALLKCHLLCIGDLVERVKQEKLDVSHFNKGVAACPKCGKPYRIMTILDFDDVGRKCGFCEDANCSNYKKSEWVEDGGDIIDAYKYFTEDYKTHTMTVIGHTNI